MRRAAAAGLWLAPALVLAVAPGSAARADDRRAPPESPQHTHDFWRDIVTPHADEIATILSHVDGNLQSFELGYAGVDATGENRMRVLRTAYNQLRLARRLAPDSVEVLERLGGVADDLGNTHQAIEALEAALAVEQDAAAPEVTALNGRLGAIYLRTRDLDQAIRYLRLAQGQATARGAQSAIALATALSMRDQMADAIDVLAAWVGPPSNLYLAGAEPLPALAVSFALAVFYDRDDQRGAAFEILDRMQTNLQPNYASQVQASLATLRFEPAEDESYFDALLYESQGDYSEARAAWATYAASGGAYRQRALEHVAAIDAERKAHPGAHPIPQSQQTVASPFAPPPGRP